MMSTELKRKFTGTWVRKLFFVCLLLLTCQFAIAQQRYYYQKVREVKDGEEMYFDDSERRTRCLIFQGNTCQWEGEFTDTYSWGKHTRVPTVFQFVRNENGNYVYEYKNSTWREVLVVSSDFSQVYRNQYYDSIGSYLLMVFQRVN